MKRIFYLLFSSILLVGTSCKTNILNEAIEDESEEHEDGMDKWIEQNRIMKMDPKLGYIPFERLDAAKQYAQSLINSNTFRTSALTWQERGPNNVGGRTRAFLVSKADATGNTVFAGGVGGGIWKCTNFKSSSYTWTPIASTTMSNLSVTSIAQDPSNNNILYAGTGEGWFNSDAIRGNGIWKSTDGGTTWSQLASTAFTATNNIDDFDYIQKIVVNSSGVVFAACRSYRYCNRGGVMRSTDGGTTWGRVLGDFPAGSTSCASALYFRGADIEIAANGDMYATTGFQNGSTNNNLGKIFKSPASLGANTGTAGNWTDITPTGSFQRIEIAVAPSDANTIYALCQSGTSGAIGGLRKSTDGGSTWSTLTSPSWCSQGSSSTDFTNTQAWYDLTAAVDPANASTCFIGGVDVLKTTDGGTSWSQVTQWSSGCSGLPQIHADNHNIQFINGSSTEMIACNDGGIYYSTNGGLTWTDRNSGYNITQFYCVDFHPTNANYFLAGAQDNGSHKLTTAGLGSSVKVTGGDGGFCHIDQTDGNIQVTSYVYNNYYYSRNGGSTFGTVSGGTSSTTAGYFINPTEYDDALDVLYTSSSSNAYGIVNGLNGSGTPAYSTISLADLVSRRVTAIKVDPNVTNGGTVWFAGYNSSGSPAFVKVSNASSTSPTTLTSSLPSTFTAGSWVNSIEVEKGNPNHLLATVTNYGANSVMESTDGGVTWSNVEGNLPDMPVYWAAFAPSDGLVTGGTTGGGVIIATEAGIWCTSALNGTATNWVPQTSNMGSVCTHMVKYRESDRTLVAATHGRGVFTTTIPSTTTGVNPTVNTKGFIDYISANSNNLLIKTGNLTGITNMTMNILDMQGRMVLSNKLNYSSQNIAINALPKGAYVVKIYGSKKEQFIQQFVK